MLGGRKPMKYWINSLVALAAANGISSASLSWLSIFPAQQSFLAWHPHPPDAVVSLLMVSGHSQMGCIPTSAVQPSASTFPLQDQANYPSIHSLPPALAGEPRGDEEWHHRAVCLVGGLLLRLPGTLVWVF